MIKAIFSRKERKERRVLFPLVFYAGAEGVANFVTTRVRREVGGMPVGALRAASEKTNGISCGRCCVLSTKENNPTTAPADCLRWRKWL